MINIVLNADDYGFDEIRTLAIRESFAKGYITATTAMSNMPFFSQTMDIAKRDGFLENVGLHLNLTEGKPLTEELVGCSFFCNEGGIMDGRFGRGLRNRLWASRAIKGVAVAEIKAQMERFLDCGGKFMHLDSHHHAHTNSALAGVIFDMARRYGFKSVRMSRTVGCKIGPAKRIYKCLYNAYAQRKLKFLVDEFTAADSFMTEFEQIKSGSSVEIMVHPMYCKGDKLAMPGTLCDYYKDYLIFWNWLCQKQTIGLIKICRYSELK